MNKVLNSQIFTFILQLIDLKDNSAKRNMNPPCHRNNGIAVTSLTKKNIQILSNEPERKLDQGIR